MKKFILLSAFFCFSIQVLAQTILWEENFNTQISKGVWGDGSGGIITNLSGVDWTLDYSNCSFANHTEFVKVDSYFSGGRFEARKCNGEAVWESKAINISNHTNIQASVEIGETGSSNNKKGKYVKVFAIVDGKEILFSNNGKGLGNFGSATATSLIPNGSVLKIRIKLRSNYAQDVYFNNIKVTGKKDISILDTDSKITGVTSPIKYNKITANVANREFQEVFKFKIIDTGTKDKSPTELSKIILEKGDKNSLDWEKQLSEAVLHSANSSHTASITKDKLTFNIPEGSMQIANNSSQEFILKIKIAALIADGTTFECQIPKTHAFKVTNRSSRFPTEIANSIISKLTTFDVQATALAFKTQPSDTQRNTVISPPIKIKAIDANNNIDTDFKEEVSLSAANIQGTTTTIANHGIATFDHIKFTKALTSITIKASSKNFTTTSSSFKIKELIDTTSIIKATKHPITKSITPNATEKVLSFVIEDKGGDGYPTRVNQLVVFPSKANELAWSKVLKKATLKMNDKQINSQVTINDSKIVFSIPEGHLSIEEGTRANFTLSVQLATSNIEEGKQLSFQILPTRHQATTSTSRSSKFARNFGQNIISSPIRTAIEASQLVITDQPTKEIAGKAISTPIKVQLQDNYENIDTDNSLTATLSIANGNGKLSSKTTLSQFPLNGIYQWRDCIYNRAETIVFNIKAAELSVNTKPITFTAAQTTTIKSSSSPIPNDTILSLRNTKSQAKDFFKFIITDQGDDGLPTKIERIRLIKGKNHSSSRLYYLIGGIILKHNNKIIGQALELNSSNGYYDITIPLNTPLNIADGKSVEMTASIFLSKHPKLKEGEKLQLAIDKKHLWTSKKEGTALFSPLESIISSPVFTIDAIATQLAFIKLPSTITPNTSFSTTVAAIDENNIKDKSYSGTVTLSREAGTGNLTSKTGLILHFSNGKAQWTDLKYNKGESFTLLANSTGFSPIESRPINGNDSNSEIKATPEIITEEIISSTITQERDAQPVFCFTLKDKGSRDGKPTILTRVTFKNAHPPNEAQWKKNIAGAVLLQDGKPVATTNKIFSDKIRFNNSNGITAIADGTSSQFILAIYLKNNNLEDKKALQFKIDSQADGFRTHRAGSGLKKSSINISSALTTLEVKASQINFLTTPYAISTATETFSITLGARDANGNIDTDYNENLSLYGGNKLLRNGSFKKGIAILNHISQSGTEDFSLRVRSGNLKEAKQKIALTTVTEINKDNFENGKLEKWKHSTDWKASIVTPINGKYSLRHNLRNAIGTSIISKEIGAFNLNEGTTVWRWQMKNGNWKPSSNNNFYYVLAATHSNLDSKTIYAVGVNASGANDLLTLWKIEDGKTTALITSEMLWEENGIAGIEVKLNSQGVWKLSYDNDGGFNNLYKTGEATYPTSLKGKLYSGFVFHYLKAPNSGSFWVDDIYTYHFSTAAAVDSLKVISDKSLAIYFNQKMNEATVKDLANYRLNKGIMISKASLETAQKAILDISQLSTDSYEIRLSGIKNTKGIALADTTIAFNYFSEAPKGAVVINELMVNEKPAQQLPEYEYIELYNTTNTPFILTNWKITIGKSEKWLTADTIQAKEYMLIGTKSATNALKIYGKFMGITSFPKLNNKGGTIILSNAKGTVIDELSYNTSWYNDTNKKNGGWSLERIDPKAKNSRASWAASQDSRGGTPAEKNSVFGLVLDPTPPRLKNTVPIAKNKLSLKFNKPIDTLAIKELKLFHINGMGMPEHIKALDNQKQIILRFKDNFEYGRTYVLQIKEVIDLYGNALENTKVTFGLPELAKAGELIINEILFNPVPHNVDYLELYNHSTKTLDLATISIANRDSRGKLKSVYPLTKTSRLLQSEEFVLLTTDSKAIAQQYLVKNPAAILEMKSLPSFPNKAGIVVVLNQELEVIDEFHYSEDMHLKLLASVKGVSLERINYKLPTQDSNNWHSAAERAGFGTPTYKNSAYSKLKTFNAHLHISPKIFSPNADGINDLMKIHYQFDTPGKITNISIFDSQGRFIVDIARNLTLGTKGIISWDGVNANGERARTGRYVVLIELFDIKGNVSIYKKTCVLHAKYR